MIIIFYEKLNYQNYNLRLTGVKKLSFKLMTNILNVQYAVDHEFGWKPIKLVMEDKLLMTLEYWRRFTYHLIKPLIKLILSI